jgi:hypothetical protein
MNIIKIISIIYLERHVKSLVIFYKKSYGKFKKISGR